MSQRVLAPILHRDSYTRLVEEEVLAYFEETIFSPLFRLLRDNHVPVFSKDQSIKFDEIGRANAQTSALVVALNSGRVQYANGVFSGKFSSEISWELLRIGAKFSPTSKTFSISAYQIPDDLKSALSSALSRTKALHEQVIGILGAASANLPTAPLGLNFTKAVDTIVFDLHKQLIQTVSGIEEISIAADVTPAMRTALTEKLTENTALGIKNFAAKRIPDLRRRVEQNVFLGMRSDRLAKIIEAEFGFTRRKALFLADQETGLLVSKYREERYAALGVQEYIWSTSHDERVRPDHRVLDGKRFSYASPPVTNRATGARNNPGCDWRCRCTPRPILSVSSAIKAHAELQPA